MKKQLLTLILLAFATTSFSQTTWIRFDGLKGESTNPKMAGKTQLAGFTWEASTPIRVGVGATGKKTYQPATIVKAEGGITPLLFQQFAQNKVIKEVVVEYWVPATGAAASTGVETLEYTVTFKNVLLSAFKQFNGPITDQKFDPSNNNILYDEIKFSYTDIIVTYKTGSIEAADQTN